MRYKYLIIFSVFLFYTWQSKGQSENIHKKSLFLGLILDKEFSNRITFSNLIQYRRIFITDKSNIFLYRPNLEYTLTEKLDFGAGYWYIRSHNPEENALIIKSSEHRIWEYLKYKIPFNNFELNNRLAFEQRMRKWYDSDGNELFGDQVSYTQRLRYRFNVDFDLFQLSNHKTIKATISEEIRIRFTSGLSDPKFDQNNTYLYLNYNVDTRSNIRLGYGVDYVKIISNVFLVNNAFRFRFNYHFDQKRVK